MKDLVKRNLVIKKEEKVKSIAITAAGEQLKEQGITVLEEIGQLTPEMIATGSWQGKSFRKFDVSAPVLPEYGGRKHILRMAPDKVKRTSSRWASRKWKARWWMPNST